jgi:hypothetical protein
MVLFLTAIDGHSQTREFSCQLPELELAFDLLSQIVARGDTLVLAYVEEDDQITQLPLDAFDGTPFLDAIGKLEQEWLSVLSHAPECGLPDYGSHQELIEWLQKRIDHYEKQMATIESIINRFKQLHCLAENCKLHDPGPSPVSNHFASLLGKYEEQLRKIFQSHQLALVRINEIKIKS